MFVFQVAPMSKMLYRGAQDLQRWTGRLRVLRKRNIDAWMGTFQADPAENADFLQVENAQLQADGLQAQQLAVQAGLQPPPILLFGVPEGLERWNHVKRREHRDRCPVSDHLFSLMTIVHADLTEQHRERLTAHLAL